MKDSIVLILPIYPVDIRGYKFIESLKDKYNIYLIVDKKKEDSKIFSDVENKIIEIVEVGNKLPTNFPFNILRDVLIQKEIKRINPKLVICRDVFLSGFIRKKEKKIEYLLDFCDNFPEVLETVFGLKGKIASRLLNQIEKNAIKKFDKTIFVSEESYRYVLEKHKISTEKYILENVPLLLKKEKEEDVHKIERLKDLIYLGTMNKRIRDFETVFKGLKILKLQNKKINVDIYYFKAQINLKKYYEQYSIDLGVKELVNFIPAVSYSELNKTLRQYKIGLVPHVRSTATDYTIPNKVYDYMKIGLPCLVSDNPSLKNLLLKYNSGEIYKGENPEDFSNQLQKMLSQNLEKYKENGSKSIKEFLNWDTQIKKIINME